MPTDPSQTRKRKLDTLERRIDKRGAPLRQFQDDKRTIAASLRAREIDHDDSVLLYDQAKAIYDAAVDKQRKANEAERRKPNDADSRNAAIFVAVVIAFWVWFFFG
jgi:hypothetical protein